jgi:LmbE family N-acetylglucosaminyl deacetylase
MTSIFFYSPHPDDETLSMGLAMVYYIANGFPVHLVSMTNGSALGVANTLNGGTELGAAVSCTISDHPYIHSPSREAYPLVDPATRLTTDDIGALRNEEARAALSMMAMVPPVVPGVFAPVYHHVENLPGDFSASDPSSSTSPPTPEGIALAKERILPYVQNYPNSFHYTMSPADHHHDHAACGLALKEIKAENPTLLGTPRYFVSRLYWAISQPDGHYQQDLLDAAAGTLAWFNYSGSHYTDYCNWLRNQVIGVYRAWNPAAGAYGVGYHQVSSQFNNNFGPSATIANLWHA